MQVLRERWRKDIDDPQVRTTHQYVLDLRERLESTVSLAQQNLQNMSKRSIKISQTEVESTFTGKPGCTTLLEHDIKLTRDAPVRVKQYPLSFNMMEAAKDEVRDIIDLGIVEPSDSPYCSPALIVKKKDNTNKFCIDFRTLNKGTVFDAEPIPNIEKIFTN